MQNIALERSQDISSIKIRVGVIVTFHTYLYYIYIMFVYIIVITHTHTNTHTRLYTRGLFVPPHALCVPCHMASVTGYLPLGPGIAGLSWPLTTCTLYSCMFCTQMIKPFDKVVFVHTTP